LGDFLLGNVRKFIKVNDAWLTKAIAFATYYSVLGNSGGEKLATSKYFSHEKIDVEKPLLEAYISFRLFNRFFDKMY
jgi:hypothetical protein